MVCKIKYYNYIGDNMKSILESIKNKKNIEYEELDKYFNDYLNGKVTDSEMTEVLKVICEYSLTEENIFSLTDIFIKSGDALPVNENFIDKHSTGGVGDKTTLIVLPILASLGVKISKMSGRGLGYTGGTIDKLESIGVKTDLTKEEFYDSIEKIGMVISSQTSNLCPMDKKIYALRDVTGTTNSNALIAISVMSKKIASGAKQILIDIKVGRGALVNTLKDARELADLMIKIGKKYDRKVVCMLTDMDTPLGDNIGNKIEVLEVIDILQNRKKNNLYDLCTQMSILMLTMSKGLTKEEATKQVNEVLEKKVAYYKFLEYVESKGGSLDIKLPNKKEIVALKSGYLKSINSRLIGESSMLLGAGRKNKNDKIDFNAGVILNKTLGSKVKKGDVLCYYYGKGKTSLSSAFKISRLKFNVKNVIIDIIK